MENLLAERGIIVSYETVRRWCQKFGPNESNGSATAGPWTRPSFESTANTNIWRAVDQDGDVIDIHSDTPTIEPKRRPANGHGK